MIALVGGRMRFHSLRRVARWSTFQAGWTPSRATMAPGFVYVMKADGPALKIGSSSDPERRRRELQTGSAADIRILHTVPVYGDPIQVERDAQAMLSAHRVRLEWYDVPPDIAVGAIYAAAFRSGSLSPILDAENREATLRLALIGAAASIPFWWLAAHGRPLGAVSYMTATFTVAAAWWLLSRRRAALPWLVGGATMAGALSLAWPAKAAEPVPSIDGGKYCASVAGFVADNEIIRKGCLSNEEKYERHVRAVWAETPQSVRDQCRKTLALVTPSYQGLSGCMSLAVGSMWMNGELRIAPR